MARARSPRSAAIISRPKGPTIIKVIVKRPRARRWDLCDARGESLAMYESRIALDVALDELRAACGPGEVLEVEWA